MCDVFTFDKPILFQPFVTTFVYSNTIKDIQKLLSVVLFYS